MKSKLFLLSLLFCCSVVAQENILASKVYSWNRNGANTSEIQSTIIFEGKGGVLSKHIMKGIVLNSDQKLSIKKSNHIERFYIVKTGLASITIKNKSTTLNRGSVVSVLPGDKLEIENKEQIPLELYEMSYQVNGLVNIERGNKAGGSFITNWDDINFKPTDKGGVRQFFDRPTSMLNRFDIHVTQLNVGFKSHDPHTHVNEEIILMLDGNAEMQIGNDHQKANPGDVVLLNSMVLHNLTNVGKAPCLYFAIQWN